MEAELYDSINDALESRRRKVALPVANPCGVDRIVWSVWDYVMGPELKFVWEVCPLPTTTAGCLDDDDDVSVIRNINSSSVSSVDEELPAGCLATEEAGASNVGEPMFSSQSTIAESESECCSPTSLANLKLNPVVQSEYESDELYSDSVKTLADEEENAKTPRSSSTTPKVDSSQTESSYRGESEYESKDDVASTASNSTISSSDDRYVAVHTLSSEIYRSNFSDSLDFKLICIPERRLVVAAYIFAAKHKDAKARHSLALLMNDKRLKWFLRLKSFCRSYFDDLVPRLKAAALLESFDELLSRMSAEFTQLLNVLGYLEHSSFETLPFQISDSYLSSGDLSSNEFLHRCISTNLQCKSQTVVIGSDFGKVNKMLRTLAFFEPKENWILCKYASYANSTVGKSSAAIKDRYCPYLKLQGYCKTELPFIIEQSVHSPWPVCLIDVDLETVNSSLPLYKHLHMKNLAKRQDLQLIVGKADPLFSKFVSEFRTTNLPNDIIQPFLAQMDFLPYDNFVREQFAHQFLRHLGHRAMALDVYAKTSTENGNNRTVLKLSKLRKALDLQLDGNFMIVLSFADRLRPGLTEFLAKKA